MLGELKDTIACDIVAGARRAGLRAAHVGCCEGMRASIRWCLERGDRAVSGAPSSSPGAAATSAPCSSTRCSTRGDACGCSTSTRRASGPATVEFVQGDVRDRRRGAGRVRRRRRGAAQRGPGAAGQGPRPVRRRSTSAARPTCSSPPATQGWPRSCTPRRAPSSASPSRNPVTEDDARPAARGVRPGQAAGRGAVPRGGGRRARRDHRAAPHDPRARAPRDHRPCCSSSWPRARPSTCSARGDNRYQFVHADDLADACLRAAERRGPGDRTTSGPPSSARCARRSQALVDHAGTGSRVRSLPPAPARLAMRGASPRSGLAPFAPYHWLLYGESLWFDTTKARTELGWEPTALERVDASSSPTSGSWPTATTSPDGMARTTSPRSAWACSRCSSACRDQGGSGPVPILALVQRPPRAPTLDAPGTRRSTGTGAPAGPNRRRRPRRPSPRPAAGGLSSPC